MKYIVQYITEIIITDVQVACCLPKAAKVLKLPLKPLSLHTKVRKLSEDQLARPRSSVKFTGIAPSTVPLAAILEWAQAVLPEVPTRLEDQVSEARLQFVSSFTGANSVLIKY